MSSTSLEGFALTTDRAQDGVNVVLFDHESPAGGKGSFFRYTDFDPPVKSYFDPAPGL